MNLVKQLTPVNLEAEKAKFFADFSYNPHFEYETLINRDQLTFYGLPKPNLLKKAQQILDQAFANRTEKQIRALEGPPLTQTQAEQMVIEFLNKNHLQDKISINWSEKYLSKASFFQDQLKLRLPFDYREKEFVGTLNHELGTHALRRLNYLQQPFYKKKKKFGFHEYLFTEEGLATLHTLMVKNFKFAYKEALDYLLTDVAQQASFARVFAFTKKYIDDDQRAWKFTARHKKGLYDTSKPGGFTKDMVYFEGMVEVGQYLAKHNFDPTQLYYGKIAIEDVTTAVKLNQDYQPLLPNFLAEDKNYYVQQIMKVIEINNL